MRMTIIFQDCHDCPAVEIPDGRESKLAGERPFCHIKLGEIVDAGGPTSDAILHDFPKVPGSCPLFTRKITEGFGPVAPLEIK